MAVIRPCPLPPDTLLAKYWGTGGYADCYTTEIQRSISHSEFVEAFYTGGVFKVERLLLSLVLSKPSTDTQAKELSTGQLGHFSAWRVEDRAPNQILMCDVSGRTRSWLMVAPASGGTTTQLYFGSAVVPVKSRSTGAQHIGAVFAALLGFHKLYSRVLLASTRSRLARKSL